MNKSAFLKLIKQVSDISDQQQSELEQVAATFPYCQTAHLLLAKSAYDRGSMLSTQRLRRASAYATDRQLLKRLIYASPVLEPAYVEETEVAEAETTAMLPVTAKAKEIEEITSAEVDIAEIEEKETVAENAIASTAINENTESGITEAATDEETAIPEVLLNVTSEVAIPDTESDQEAETLDQVYSHTSAENMAYTEQDSDAETESENPEAEIDSELALLFTFSSIGPSSTDLISRRDAEAGIDEQAEVDADGMHLAETVEALHDLEEAQEEVPTELTSETIFEDSTAAFIPEVEDNEAPHQALATLEDEAVEEITEPTPTEAAAEDAEINYSFDEIDRLYAEDALGYWMGSSRMGEVLQLKDDYTRPRPQSFHPELILEYSRTHELEKAIQPTKHVLSKQLDIIDQFLKLNPRLKTMASLKLKPEPQEDLSLKSSKIKKGMATESLANIFVQQGKPKKAVKIYEQLILKYPEKKSYFAEQIEKLQNIT